MPDMERSNYEANLNEIGYCFTLDQANECCGASGWKFRHVCLYCPNYNNWLKTEQLAKTEKEGKRGKRK